MARTYRFFIASEKLGQDLTLGPHNGAEIFDQLVKVLRVKPGDIITLLNAENDAKAGARYPEYEYTVEEAHKKELKLRFAGRNMNEHEMEAAFSLVLCLPNKPDKLAFILQKAVELGVVEVILAEGDNSQMKQNLRQDRLERIMKEAAEQSERAFVPAVRLGKSLRAYLENSDKEGLYVAMERDKCDAPDFFARGDKGGIKIVIGPEGGFSEEERKLVAELGIKKFTLGRRILRMETAVILSLGLAGMQNEAAR